MVRAPRRPSACCISAASFEGPSHPSSRRFSPASSASRSFHISVSRCASDQPSFKLRSAYALFAKRAARPFPPPFLSRPSGSFSDALSTYNESRFRQASYRGQLLRGVTNGEDAIVTSSRYIGVNDGVGGWSQKARGHPALWSRLMIHFWSLCMDSSIVTGSRPDTVRCLENAFKDSDEATAQSSRAMGSTTSSTAVLYNETSAPKTPLLAVTTLGDSKIMVIRPSTDEIHYSSKEQWLYFNCPLQLGTGNSVRDAQDAEVEIIKIQENDIVLALTDGVTDNLWQHEILEIVMAGLRKYADDRPSDTETSKKESLKFAARRLVAVARSIAQDPTAESPFMEAALANRQSWQGGKLDDISVVIARCEANASAE